MKTAEFGQPAARVPQPGKCRICGIAEDRSYHRPGVSVHGTPFSWVDETRTLCDMPSCIAAAKREIGR